MSESDATAGAAAAPVEPPPDGFVPLEFGGPYFRALGAVHGRRQPDGGLVVALRVAEGHLNIQGFAHGGMLTTLADGALGLNIAIARGRRGAQVTASLSADFLSSARRGDWLEAHVTITRMGRRMAYASCDLRAGSRHVLRASAVFAFVERELPPGAGGLPSLADG
jgi:uncharacterized protein (TIGR00369 family)